MSHTVRFPWWANPALLLVVGLCVVLYSAAAVTAQQYESWGMPAYATPVEALAVGWVLAAALLGIVAARIIRRPVALGWLDETSRFLKSRMAAVLMYGLAGLAVLGYAFWISGALRSGLTLGEAIATLRGEPGAVTQLKGQAQTSAGLTTLTQFGPVAALLGVARRRLANRGGWLVVAAILGLSLLRFLFYAERIAFLEIAVPVIILFVALPPAQSRWVKARRRVVAFLPLILGAAVLALFAGGEYLRTWSWVREDSGSFADFIIDRFLSYYATATNNGVLYSRLADANDLDQVTFYALNHFPGGLFGTGTVDGIDFDRWWEAQLENYGNPSLNNLGTVFPMIGELSLAVTLVIAFVVALGSILLFRLARAGHIVALLAVPVMCFAFLELPRISYFTLGRSTPIVAGIVAVWFVYDLWRMLPRRTPTQPSGDAS